MGTMIENLPLVRIVDGDTLVVDLNGKHESLRLICVDTEECRSGSNKPVTRAGQLAKRFAMEYFTSGNRDADRVDIEFDTHDPLDICLKKHRGNHGRLLCYVHKNGENYNLKLVEQGWSPYFIKYGRSRLRHKSLSIAEARAQSTNRGIWNKNTNAGGEKRDYERLVPWWSMRSQVVQDYRQQGIKNGILSVRLDYDKIVDCRGRDQAVSVLCDLQDGVNQYPGNGALIYAGSRYHKFNLWIPDIHRDQGRSVLRLLQTRYFDQGRGYVYIRGAITEFAGVPQIEILYPQQLSDFSA